MVCIQKNLYPGLGYSASFLNTQRGQKQDYFTYQVVSNNKK